MRTVSEKNNFLYLTVGIVLLLFVSALSDQFPGIIGHRFVLAFSVINIVTSLYGFRSEKMWFHTGFGIIASVVVVVLIGVVMEFLKLYYLHLLLLLSFYIWAIWLAGRQVMKAGEVDANRIVGAICIYLLMGLIWALLFSFLAQSIPGAFNGLEQLPWFQNFANVSYYSFVTLTTLGYGDISPVAPIARYLVYMEAVVGVFYMAILVASLIGMGLNSRHR
jgi:hypothetical protein